MLGLLFGLKSSNSNSNFSANFMSYLTCFSPHPAPQLIDAPSPHLQSLPLAMAATATTTATLVVVVVVVYVVVARAIAHKHGCSCSCCCRHNRKPHQGLLEAWRMWAW